MSPILLDHRLLKVLWLGVAVLVFMTFMGGYILGFEKSDSSWKTNLDHVELVLPIASISALAEVEAQIPEFEQPGADIDVDAADAPVQVEVMIPAAVGSYNLEEPGFEEKTVELLINEPIDTTAIKNNEYPAQKATLIELVVSDEGEQADKPDLISLVFADSDTAARFIGPMRADYNELATLTEPLPNNAAMQPVSEPVEESQIEAPSELSVESLASVDDATEADAKYSIQVGMYSSSANAAARELLLREANLSAYSMEYLNSNDELRYNVRFGYFASKARAQQALDAFQQQFSANGFIVRFKR